MSDDGYQIEIHYAIRYIGKLGWHLTEYGPDKATAAADYRGATGKGDARVDEQFLHRKVIYHAWRRMEHMPTATTPRPSRVGPDTSEEKYDGQ